MPVIVASPFFSSTAQGLEDLALTFFSMLLHRSLQTDGGNMDKTDFEAASERKMRNDGMWRVDHA